MDQSTIVYTRWVKLGWYIILKQIKNIGLPKKKKKYLIYKINFNKQNLVKECKIYW